PSAWGRVAIEVTQARLGLPEVAENERVLVGELVAGAHERQRVIVLPLIPEDASDARNDEAVQRVELLCGSEFPQRRLEQPDVKEKGAERCVKRRGVRLERECALVVAHRAVELPTALSCVREIGARMIGLGIGRVDGERACDLVGRALPQRAAVWLEFE